MRGTWPLREKTPQADLFLQFTMYALEHARAITFLAGTPTALRLSTLALMRPMIECLARGIWALDATDTEMKRVVEGHDPSNAGLKLFREKPDQKAYKNLRETSRTIVDAIRKILGGRASEEKLESGKPRFISWREMWNTAVHGNMNMARCLGTKEGFGSEHVPEDLATETAMEATDWAFLTAALVIDVFNTDSFVKDQLLAVRNEWRKAAEEFKSTRARNNMEGNERVET